MEGNQNCHDAHTCKHVMPTHKSHHPRCIFVPVPHAPAELSMKKWRLCWFQLSSEASWLLQLCSSSPRDTVLNITSFSPMDGSDSNRLIPLHSWSCCASGNAFCNSSDGLSGCWCSLLWSALLPFNISTQCRFVCCCSWAVGLPLAVPRAAAAGSTVIAPATEAENGSACCPADSSMSKPFNAHSCTTQLAGSLDGWLSSAVSLSLKSTSWCDNALRHVDKEKGWCLRRLW